MTEQTLVAREEWDSAVTGQAALLDMVSAMSRAGLVVPPVPAHLVDSLRGSKGGGAWSTADWIPSSAVYFDAFVLTSGRRPSLLSQLMADDRGDFWLMGHRGHGFNSYAFGLVARIGPVLVAQQAAYGGAFTDHDRATQRVNLMMSSFAALLHGLSDLDESSGRLERLVWFSVLRGFWVLAGRTDDPAGAARPLRVLPEGWSVEQGIPSRVRSNEEELEELAARSVTPDVGGLAARHLHRVLEGVRSDRDR